MHVAASQNRAVQTSDQAAGNGQTDETPLGRLGERMQEAAPSSFGATSARTMKQKQYRQKEAGREGGIAQTYPEWERSLVDGDASHMYIHMYVCTTYVGRKLMPARKVKRGDEGLTRRKGGLL